MGEFELIRKYFNRPARKAVLGIGDDCALLVPQAGCELAISTDMLVEGRHFYPDADPDALGWKTLAVNLSDLAAMGAEPLAFTLALALPDANETWLASFAHGLFACADHYGCELIGGDTTRGPRNLCVTVFGNVPRGEAIRRDGARSGDDIWVSGRLGDAALGLRVLQDTRIGKHFSGGTHARLMAALHRPHPRVALGMALRGTASAMLDISDGLTGDLTHILDASGVGATVEAWAIPVSDSVADADPALRWTCALGGGDDYELCFTASPALHTTVEALARSADVPVTRIGRIVSGRGLQLVDEHGAAMRFPDGYSGQAFDHFA